MKASAYLDAMKAQIDITSDYELAKRLEVESGQIARMRSGARPVPPDIAFRIAIALDLDPARVIADLEEQREKNEKRKAFWRSFLSRVICIAALAIHTLVLPLSATCGSGLGPHGGSLRQRRPWQFA